MNATVFGGSIVLRGGRKLYERVVALTTHLIGSKFAVRYFFATATLLYFLGMGRVVSGLLDFDAICALLGAYLAAVAVLHAVSAMSPSIWIDRAFVLIEAPIIGVLIAHDPNPGMPLQLLLLIDMLDHGLRFGLRRYMLDGVGFLAAIAVGLLLRAGYIDGGVEPEGLWVLFLALSGSFYALRILAERESADEQALDARSSIAVTVESTGVGVWTYDFEGRRLQWDANTERLGGLPPGTYGGGFDEFLGMLRRSDAERLVRLAESAVRARQPWEQEYEVIWADGSVHLIASRGVTSYAGDGTPLRMHGVSWDVTGLRRDSRSAVEADARLRTMQALVRAGFWTLDTHAQSLRTDDAIHRLFGMVRPGQSPRVEEFMAAIVPEDQERVREALQHALDTGAPYLSEYRIIRADGDIRTLRSAAHAVTTPGDSAVLVGATVDITAERRDQQHLRAALGRLQALGESARIGNWTYDPARDQIQADERFEALLGLEPGTFGQTRDNVLSNIHPDDRERVAAYIARTLEQGSVVDIEYRAAWPNGSVHRLLTRGSVDRDADGKAVLVRGVTMDLTRLDNALAVLLEPTT